MVFVARWQHLQCANMSIKQCNSHAKFSLPFVVLHFCWNWNVFRQTETENNDYSIVVPIFFSLRAIKSTTAAQKKFKLKSCKFKFFDLHLHKYVPWLIYMLCKCINVVVMVIFAVTNVNCRNYRAMHCSFVFFFSHKRRKSEISYVFREDKVWNWRFAIVVKVYRRGKLT